MLPAPGWVHVGITRLVFDVAKLYLLGMGGAILLAGAEYMAAPSYTVLLQWAPWWVWGASLMAWGAVTLVPHQNTRMVGFCGAAVWFWIWTAALIVNFVSAVIFDRSPKPGPTGVPTYVFLTVLFTALAVAMVMARHERPSHARY